MLLDKYTLIARFLRADKPAWVLPIDAFLLIRLLMREDSEMQARVSQSTLAAELCCADRTIFESIQRLREHGWLTVQGGKKSGLSSVYAVQIDKLPLSDDLKRTIISTEAADLAKQLYTAIHRVNPKAKIFHGWQQRFGIALQRKLDQGCEIGRLVELLNFAFSHPGFKTKALKGPQALRRVWPTLEAAYDTKQSTAAPQQAPPPKIDWDEIARRHPIT